MPYSFDIFLPYKSILLYITELNMPPKVKLFQQIRSKQIYDSAYFCKNNWMKHLNSVYNRELSYVTICLKYMRQIFGITQNAWKL